MKKLKITISKKEAFAFGTVVGAVGTFAAWWKLPVCQDTKAYLCSRIAEEVLEEALKHAPEAKCVVSIVGRDAEKLVRYWKDMETF